MKSMWMLTARTSLPKVCESDEDIKETKSAFQTFEGAKRALREKLKELAFVENAMFDGNGFLKNLSLYIKDIEKWEEEYADGCEDIADWLYGSVLRDFHTCLHEVLSGNNVKLSFARPRYSDVSIRLDIKRNTVDMRGYGEGPMNGINPRIKTNMFDMSEEKDYFLYIDDYFGEHLGIETSAELYIDLKKVEFENSLAL